MSASSSNRALSATAACAVVAACLVLFAVAPAFAAFPGANGKIAFSQAGKIYAVSPASGAVSTLGKGLANGDWPVWSPDGKKIAFMSGGGIAVASAGAGASKTIVRAGIEVEFLGYAFGGWDPGLVGMPLNGGVQPTWSPNGRKLGFIGGVGDSGFDVGVFTIKLDGTALTMHSDTGVAPPHEEPAWSPDGSVIAVSNYDRPGGGYALQTIRMIADPLAEFYVGGRYCDDVRGASWAPSSSRVAFSGSTQEDEWCGTGATLSDEIWTMASDGTDRQQITNDLTNERGVSWSPDGAQIAFIRADGPTPGIYALPATGGAARLLYAGQGITHIDWQPLPTKSKR
jgi:Tol biopolymer transport system component